jgi:hypothetical protein
MVGGAQQGRAGGWAAGARWLVAGLLLAAGSGCGEGLEDADAQELADEEVTSGMPDVAQVRAAAETGMRVSANLVADARVSEDQPGANFGTTTRLRADGAPGAEAYLRFEGWGLNSTVQHARLRLYATSASRGTVRVYRTSNDWQETGITWSNRPAAVGEPLASAALVADEAWLELDVTAAVQNDGAYSFVVRIESEDGATFVSRESALEALRPELAIQTQPWACEPGETVVDSGETLFPFQTFDAYADAPTATDTRDVRLKVDGDPQREAFLGFSVNRDGRKLKYARLTLYPVDGSAVGPTVHLAEEGSWGGTTWDGRPALQPAPVATMGALKAGTRASVDVTHVLQSALASGSGDTVRILLGLRTQSPDGAHFSSMYHASDIYWPRLSLLYEGACGEELPPPPGDSP